MTARPSLEQALGCLAHYDPDALPVDDARRVIRAFVTPVAVRERVAVRDALERVLAADIIATRDVPAHDNCAMDGYALRHADLDPAAATTLRVIGTAYAGRALDASLGPGECVRVMTGAVLPRGTDTVVPQELARADGTLVHLRPDHVAGQHVRRAGEDLARGSACLPAGRRVRPADLGLIASMGLAEVDVWRRPRVAFLSTGDELAPVGRPLVEGEVYDSNRYTLFGMLRRLGVDIVDMGVVRDDPAALEAALRNAAASADAVITSGGVSVGEADYTRTLLDRLGEAVSWTVAMRPGRPMALGRIGDALFFGLPGNPVAVMVTFVAFVRGALLQLAGCTDEAAVPAFQVRSASAIAKRPGRTEFQRGIVGPAADGLATVRVTGQQGSGVLRSMSEANCLIVLEHARGRVEAGELVTVQPFDGLF